MIGVKVDAKAQTLANASAFFTNLYLPLIPYNFGPLSCGPQAVKVTTLTSKHRGMLCNDRQASCSNVGY